MSLYTDLLEEKSYKSVYSRRSYYNDINIVDSTYKNNNYTTIYFNSNSDYKDIGIVLKKKLYKYIRPKRSDNILVVGLGNEWSTPDALGPNTIDNILVTRHLKMMGINKYISVSVFRPGVLSSTGMESIDLIKCIIKGMGFNKIIIIDSLKTNSDLHLLSCIQITNSGIHPGSGINNDRGDISKRSMGVDVISIGIPTVIEDDNNMILTRVDIDYKIDLLSKLIGNSINECIQIKNS